MRGIQGYIYKIMQKHEKEIWQNSFIGKMTGDKSEGGADPANNGDSYSRSFE